MIQKMITLKEVPRVKIQAIVSTHRIQMGVNYLVSTQVSEKITFLTPDMHTYVRVRIRG